MATRFGNTTSEDPRTANMIYCDVFGKVLVRYGAAAGALFLDLAILAVLFIRSFSPVGCETNL
jgi:hypothetical protein